MRIGVISGCKGKRKLRGILKKPEILKLSDDFFVAEIPISEEKLEETAEKKLRRQTERAKKMLEAVGVKRILLTEDLKALLKEPKFNFCDWFYRVSHKIVLWAAERFRIEYPIKLAIRQENPDFCGFYTAQKLIYDCSDLVLLTDKTQKGNKFCDKIMAEYGAATEILPYNALFGQGITVDLDRCEIRVLGKYVLNDFETADNTFGYNVSPVELCIARNGDYGDIEIKSCLCGKNKLTLQ